MLAATALISLYADWVPARWASADPKSLELLSGTPINCVWLERPQWSRAFLEEAAKRGIATVAIIRREGDAVEASQTAVKMKFDAVVTEGDFDDYTRLIVAGMVAKSKALLIESVPRARMRFDGAAPILATSQGLWPGIHVEAGGSASAGPTANPWIDTNTGFIRFARASTNAVIWLANRPPPKTVVALSRYLQAVGDAEMSGGRWVISLDDDFSTRLLAGDAKALSIGAASRPRSRTTKRIRSGVPRRRPAAWRSSRICLARGSRPACSTCSRQNTFPPWMCPRRKLRQTAC